MSKHKKHDKKTVKKEKLQPAAVPETTENHSKSEEFTKKAKKFADETTQKARKVAHEAEETIDKMTDKAKKYISNQGKKDFDELEKETVERVNKVAEGVEHLGEGYEDLIESIFPTDHSGSRIVYEADRNENVDRWVIFRVLWSILLAPVMAIWGAWISLIWIVFMIKIILTGKRDRILWNKMIRFANYILNWDAYMGGLIDRRPEIVE